MTVKGLSPAAQRVLKAFAKRVGNEERALRIAVRAGLVALKGRSKRDLPELEAQLEADVAALDAAARPQKREAEPAPPPAEKPPKPLSQEQRIRRLEGRAARAEARAAE